MTAADNTCEHGWTWGQCCPKPWPSADRTAFTHGLELLDGPAVLAAMTPRPADEVVISAAPAPEGVPEDHRVCSHGIYHHGCPSCDRQDPEERL